MYVKTVYFLLHVSSFGYHDIILAAHPVGDNQEMRRVLNVHGRARNCMMDLLFVSPIS